MTDLSWPFPLLASTFLSTVVAVTLSLASDLSKRVSASTPPERIESLEASRRSLQVAKDCATVSSEIEAKVIGLVDSDMADSGASPEPSESVDGQVLDNGL
jgi:hypothetical protein